MASSTFAFSLRRHRIIHLGLGLHPGTRFGVYEVTAQIGEGGMGQVYRATDTTLGRQVAIKILPDAFASDRERVARFEREAKTLAALNHPNIAAIYGFEKSAGAHALIMELVEGEDLSQRIMHGAILLDDALPIAKQIAEALEAAHERGIIHRDLKPANVKVRPDGTVKVLDFGLATAAATEAGSPELSNSPTLMTSTPGLVLGTAPYMSPEQANGMATDRASDVWAFGCVLYEMLTGHRVFVGDTLGEILAAVLKTEPDWSRLPRETPDGIRRLLRRSLRKDRRVRLRDIRDARLEIEDVRNGIPAETRPADSAVRRRERVAWALGLSLVTLIAATFGALLLRRATVIPETHLEITTPPGRDPSLAISPDGRRIVFTAMSAGQSQLWLRALDASSARPLRGTERGSSPFWSSDGRSIGFFADARVKLLDIESGTVRTLPALAPAPMGGTWNSDGTILVSTSPGSPIFRITADGGGPSAVTHFEAPQRSQSSPSFLPDGRRFLFFVNGSPEARGVYVGTVDEMRTTRLFGSDAAAVYAPTGHLLFIREERLLAQRFDADRLQLFGEPIPIAEHVPAGTIVSVSAGGSAVVYRTPASDSGQRQLVWFDRSGSELEKVVYPDTASQGPSLSRDGRRAALFRFANGNMDIWSYERVRRTWDRITVSPGDDIFPLWSTDGTRMVFASRRSPSSERVRTPSSMDLYSKLLSAPPGQGEDVLLSTPETKFPTDWSSDERFVLYNRITATSGVDIWVLPLDGDPEPRAVLHTEFNEQHGQFSPDGKWIAYQSDRTGRFEIYVRPFPGPGIDTPVSVDGGTQVRWNSNGRELFYVAPDDWLMAAPLEISAGRETVEPGAPVRLFLTNVGSTAVNTNRHQYSVSADGNSFMMNSVVGEASASPITVILNWTPKLR